MDSLGSLHAFVSGRRRRSFTLADASSGVSSRGQGHCAAGRALGVRSFTLHAQHHAHPEGALFLERCRASREVEAAELELAQTQGAPRASCG